MEQYRGALNAEGQRHGRGTLTIYDNDDGDDNGEVAVDMNGRQRHESCDDFQARFEGRFYRGFK